MGAVIRQLMGAATMVTGLVVMAGCALAPTDPGDQMTSENVSVSASVPTHSPSPSPTPDVSPSATRTPTSTPTAAASSHTPTPSMTPSSTPSVVTSPEVRLGVGDRLRATVNTDQGLKLRMNPSSDAESIVVIPYGAEVTELGYNKEDFEWVYISYGNAEGWVSSKYLQFTGR